MDRHGMQIIERLDSKEFLEYLNETENTICGRNPISIFLQMVEMYHENASNERVNMEFLDYSQSSKVKSADESSVSYAAGCAYVWNFETTTDSGAWIKSDEYMIINIMWTVHSEQQISRSAKIYKISEFVAIALKNIKACLIKKFQRF